MKNIIIKILSILFLFSFSQSATAQALEIKNNKTTYDENNYPCVEVMLEPVPKKVKDAWEDFIKDKIPIIVATTRLSVCVIAPTPHAA